MQNKDRQIFYIEIDEEISSIIERLKRVNKRQVLLVVPKKAILFQSVVNLKILKSKLTQDNKDLVIVTTDRNGEHLSKKVGLKVWPRVEIDPVNEKSEEEDGEINLKIRPIQARRNPFSKEESPERVRNKKMSISELIEKFRRNNESENSSFLPQGSLPFSRQGRSFLVLIVLLSTLLFMLIGYIALPSATIYIRPKFDNLDYTTNIVLADKRKNQNLIRQNKSRYIASEEVSTTTKQTKVFKTANKEFKGVNAKGKIKVINTTNEPWELRGGTRFQSEDGIIFRMASGVEVPSRSRDENDDLIPGEMIVSVEADPFDIYQKPVGRRGNLPPAKFSIPALTKYNQRLIWGESEEAMIGGVTDYQDIVKKEDIESAKKQIQDNLILMAKEELKTYIDEVNKLNKTNLVLLDDARYLKTDLLDLKIADDLEGSYQEKFEIYAEIEAVGIAFDFNRLYEILKEEIADRVHPNMKLREGSIVPENITYEIVEEDDLIGQIKMTATVVGIEEFAIDASTPAGIEFGNSIRQKIIGMDAEKAESLIGNLSEVDLVEVNTWPIWINKVPRLPERIKIKLME